MTSSNRLPTPTPFAQPVEGHIFSSPPAAPFVPLETAPAIIHTITGISIRSSSPGASSSFSDDSSDSVHGADVADVGPTGMHDIDELLKIPQFPRSLEDVTDVMKLAMSIRRQRAHRRKIAEFGVQHSGLLSDLWKRELSNASSDVQQSQDGIIALRSLVQRTGLVIKWDVLDADVEDWMMEEGSERG
ncbi:hypothetical protein DENSPDRAFT_880151 [Dentipellis sp. KUC8613]|nr:hypothetical protein DENSPDRAFT_880146 [Dentipellis sp. KUC8613]KAA1471031.1 hypothetical protein DENSPDRAFT_880151 [Dentipellis sp. KUC8613]